MIFKENVSTKFDFFKIVHNFIHKIHTGIYSFFNNTNNLLTYYPLLVVDNRTVVLKWNVC